MNVFLLSAHEHSDWTLLGIYSTREKAEAAKAEYETPYRPSWADAGDDLFTRRANNIQEIPLDQKHDEDDWKN